MQWLQRVDV